MAMGLSRNLAAMINSNNADPHERRLIVGGHEVKKGRYPYFCSIDKNNGVVLNGALIAPDIVVSAGHIALNHMDNLTLTVGAWDVHNVTDDEQVIEIEEWMVHPKWSQYHSIHFSLTDNLFRHDAMLFKLAAPVALGVTPVKINRNSAIPVPHEQKIVVMGLGWTNKTILSPAPIVRETSLLTITNEECGTKTDPGRNLSYVGLLDDTMFCTESPPPSTDHDSCAWDSGAPLIVKGADDADDLLVGLGSTGVSCADPIFPCTLLYIEYRQSLLFIYCFSMHVAHITPTGTSFLVHYYYFIQPFKHECRPSTIGSIRKSASSRATHRATSIVHRAQNQ